MMQERKTKTYETPRKQQTLTLTQNLTLLCFMVHSHKQAPNVSGYWLFYSVNAQRNAQKRKKVSNLDILIGTSKW